jgi:putative Holliday junction resolvase
MTRYLGIDYGSKRIGIAISDETNSFAFPLRVLENTGSLIDDIYLMCEANKVTEIVVGESLNFVQKENKIMEEIKPFVKNLEEKLSLPVHMHPEFLTSQEADRLQGRNSKRDASAAALILKSYLDLKVTKLQN